jgi:NADPH:quinone reductase-like Zn-dependent oxidoreductase
MSDSAEAFWVAAPGRGEIRPVELPVPAGHEVVVRALYSGISRGTEATVFLGRVPASERDRMRAPFQEGDFPAPVKYGYASVGHVERGPPSLAGRTVFVLYPHQTRYVVPAAAVHVLPDAVPPARAVLAANLETAINGLWDAAPRAGDRITVVGAGVVGCLVAWLAARTAGCRVELVDVNASRSAVADALGVPFALAGAATPGADLVVHASGAPSGLTQALDLAGFEATIVEMSWFGDQMVSLPLGGAFHTRRLTIRASQVGHVAPAQRARWDTHRRMALALSLLADEALDVLISGESAFHDLPDVMVRLTKHPASALCHRIRYPEPSTAAESRE